MQLAKKSVAKIVLGAVTLLALFTLYAKPASASRYAVAYIGFMETCTSNPGNQCGGTN